LLANRGIANAFTGRSNVPKSLQGWQMNDNGPEIRTDRQPTGIGNNSRLFKAAFSTLPDELHFKHLDCSCR
jgi:hypothetical protein